MLDNVRVTHIYGWLWCFFQSAFCFSKSQPKGLSLPKSHSRKKQLLFISNCPAPSTLVLSAFDWISSNKIICSTLFSHRPLLLRIPSPAAAPSQSAAHLLCSPSSSGRQSTPSPLWGASSPIGLFRRVDFPGQHTLHQLLILPRASPDHELPWRRRRPRKPIGPRAPPAAHRSRRRHVARILC